jgi:ADP-ribose pyrophosphatase YjhB (NUDIX family)
MYAPKEERPLSTREYPPRPIVAVGGVTFRGEEVLLAQRGKAPGYGTWTIPGGALKVGESLREGTAREVREECGIEVEVGEVAEVFERIIRDDDGRVRFHYVVVDFVAEHKSGDLAPATDCLDARWVPLDRLGEYNLTQAASDAIAKARRLIAERPRP